jgi:hypothetical protein
MKQPIFNTDFTVSLLPGFNAIASTDVKMQRPINTQLANDSKKTILFWGDNNTFPQDVIADVRKDPEIGTLLDKQANLLYSGGLMWGIPEIDANGQKVYTPLDKLVNDEIMLWLKRSNINRYMAEAAKDLYYFGNAFPEIILQGDRTKIIQICAQAAEECRFGVQNSAGLIDICYINAQWETAKQDDPLTKTVSVLDAYYDPASQLAAGNKLNYIYPLNYANPGNKFYQMADWNSIRESGWLEVSQLIPQFKKALLKNQMTIKYHIKIMNTYWTAKFEGYDIMPLSEKKAIKEKEMTAIQDMLVGSAKAGKSFVSPKYWDPITGKEQDLITIESIDDKLQDGKYLEEGKDASLYKGAAVGLHPALVGSVPNSGMGGAGSNIREAYNLHVLSSRSRQDLILEPLNNVLIEYNGWPLNMEFAFRNQFMTTLDAGKETTTNTSNTPVK